MDEYLTTFDECRQWEKPFCTAACPFRMDVLDFQEKIARGSYTSAYKTFRNATAFPDIVAALCPGYCLAVCPRKDIDAPVRLDWLERTCVARVKRKEPTDYNVPSKSQRVAIVGAGLSGLGCALRLASKRYQVTLYEARPEVGGRVAELLPEAVWKADIDRQMQFLDVERRFSQRVNRAEDLTEGGFDAVYIATGSGGEAFGLTEYDPPCIGRGKTAWFAGGGLIGHEPIRALAQGLDIAWSIEVYLKTGKLEYPTVNAASRAVIEPGTLIPTPLIEPSDGGLYTDEETIAEAGRCIRCQCNACRVDCDLCGFYNKWPLKMRDEIMATVSPSDSLIHTTPAKRLINNCTHCGIFEEECPANINLDRMIMEARRRLHRTGKMPGAYHQFWMADMRYANGEWAALSQPAPRQNQTKDAFFPGCQLGASEPEYVVRSYRQLLNMEPATGLMLSCCGVPAEWAGNGDAHAAEIERLKAEWTSLGRPRMILACPNCLKKFREHLPEIPVVSLYEIFCEAELPLSGNPADSASSGGSTAQVFDACAARHEPAMREAVRRLAERAGVVLTELPHSEKLGCCGYGGHGDVANPHFVDYVAKRRIEVGDAPYITYCVNCRDLFLGHKKPTRHLLDVLFGIHGESAAPPDLTTRRQNRTALKRRLLAECWEEAMPEKPTDCTFGLIISPELRRKMDDQKILEEDLCRVIELAEQLNRRVRNAENGTYACFRELGAITLWVEYRLSGDAREIVNLYTHRIKIELEMIYNGRKTDFDLR